MAKRTAERDQWHARGFAAGVAVACGIIMSGFDREVEVEEVLRACGYDTREKLKRAGADDYDLKLLRSVFRTMRESDRWATDCPKPTP